MGAIRYRVGQFVRALRPRVCEDEVRAAIECLNLEARDLFKRQEIQDQRHAVAVYRALLGRSHTDPDLLAAALLHDTGKAAAPCPPSARAAAVLMGRYSPRLLARLSNLEQFSMGGRNRLPGWRRALCAHVHHAEVGARWAHEAGCSERTVTLIRRHRDELDPAGLDDDPLLAALLAADAIY